MVRVLAWAMRKIKHPKLDQIELTDIMYALSDPARVEIIKALSTCGAKTQTCSELQCDRPKSSMSHHFKILRESGLLETQIEGKEYKNSLRTSELEKKFPGLMKSILKVIQGSK